MDLILGGGLNGASNGSLGGRRSKDPVAPTLPPPLSAVEGLI